MVSDDSSIHVLHVDDEPGLAEVAADFLEQSNDQITVTTATSANDGLDFLSENSIDCIVSDYDMPEMNGIEFLREIREAHPALPFILYTGKGSEEVASEAISNGVTEYMQKEVGTDQYLVLANRIENAVNQYRAEQEIDTTRQRFRLLVEEATDAVLVVAPDGTFSFATPAVKTVLGRSPEELVGVNGFDLVHPGDLDQVQAAFGHLVENPEERRTVEFRYERPDGSWVWVEARGRNLLDHPIIEGIVVYVRDVTDRKERELELRQTERQYQAIFNDPNILVGSIALDGTVLDINETAMGYIDASIEEVAGTPFWETPWFDHNDQVREDLQKWIDMAANGEYVEFELDLVRPDGDPYTVEGVFRPVKDDDGDVVSLIISDREITERKQRERELQQERDRFQAVFDEAFDAIVIANDEGRYIDVNESATELFGLSEDELLGRSIVEFALEDFDFEAAWEEFHASEQERGTFPLVRPDGTKLLVEYGATRDIVPGQHLSVLRDITDREGRN